MPTIRIDDEAYEFLERHVEGFETPNDVIKRLLGLNNKDNKGELNAGRRKRGQVLHRSEYRIPILESLVELGGSGETDEVLKRVFQRVKHRLTAYDNEDIPSGTEIRWRKNANWERFNMAREELLNNNSPKGIWEITEEGRNYLKNNK
jgi:predicted CopG family antitoxin